MTPSVSHQKKAAPPAARRAAPGPAPIGPAASRRAVNRIVTARGGEAGEARENDKPVELSEYELTVLRDGGVTLAFNPRDVLGWTDRLMESFGRYVEHILPGATREEVAACAKALSVVWVVPLPEHVERLPYVPVTFQAALHSGVVRWFRDHRPDLVPRDPVSGSYRLADTVPGGGEPGQEEIRTFDPQGSIQFEPNVGTFVLGSTVRARLEFTGEAVRRAFNYSSGSAFFDWSVVDDQGREVLSGPFLEGYGDRVWEIDLDSSALAAGKLYTIRVSVFSRWFRTGSFAPAPVTFSVAAEGQRSAEVFDLLLADPAQSAPFERVDGQLQLKAGAGAATVDDEISRAAFWLGAVKGLETSRAIPASQAAEYREILQERKENLEEKRDLLRGAVPYTAFGTLLDADSSAYTRLSIAVYGEQRRTGKTVRYTVRLVDSTLAANDPPVYEGEGEREAAADTPEDLAATARAAEDAALTALLDHWQSLNNYPDGTIRLGVRLAGGGVRELSFSTRNLRKPVKRNAGRVALGAGGLGLGLSVYTGGGSAPPALALLETGATLAAAGATLTDVGLRLEERIGTRTLRADRQLVLDALQVASLALGGWGQLVKNARPLGKGFVLASAGLDAGQLVVMTGQVRRQIGEVELRYEQQAQGVSDDERRKLIQQRDEEIAGIVGEAAVGGGLTLLSVGKGVKDLVTPSAHPPAPVHEAPPPPVREAPPALEAPQAPEAPKAPEAPAPREPLTAPPAPLVEALPLKVAEAPAPPAPAPPAPAAPTPVAKAAPPVKPGALRNSYETFLRAEIERPATEARRTQASFVMESVSRLDREYRDIEKLARHFEEIERLALEPPKPGEAPAAFDAEAHQAAVAGNEAARQKVLADTAPLAGTLRQQAAEALAADLGGTPAQLHELLGRVHPAEARGLYHEIGKEGFAKLLAAGSDNLTRFLAARERTALVPAGRARLLEILRLHTAGTLDDVRLGSALSEALDFLALYPNGVQGDFRRLAAAFDPNVKLSPTEALSTGDLYIKAQSRDPEAAHELDLRRKSLAASELQAAAQRAESEARLARKERRKDDARAARAEETRLRTLLSERNLLLEGQSGNQGPFTSHPELRVVLERDIQQARVVPRFDIPVSDDAVVGGTVGAARTDIPGIDPGKPVIGRSPLAHAEGEASTINPRYQSPADTPAAKGHAEQTLTGNLANEIDQLIAGGKLTQGDLQGKTVWMLIDQEVCSYCASGLDSPVAPGVLAQFSQEYPLLTIQIKNLRTSDLLILRGGRRINP